MASDNSVSFATTKHVHDHCLCFAAQRAARALARRFDEALRPVGLTSWQFSLLMSLNREEPATVGVTAAVLGIDRTTLTANLKPLERDRLVTSAVDPADRRGRLLVLTATGRKKLKAALPIWKRTHEEIDDLLVPKSGETMRAGLRALAKGY